MTVRWILDDDSVTHTFKVNPVSITSPFPNKALLSEPVANSGGIPAPVVKQPTVAQNWIWTGNFYTDTEKNIFESWHTEHDQPFKVTDHLLRIWVVLSVDLDITERRPTATNSNRYTYKWTVLNLGREEES